VSSQRALPGRTYQPPPDPALQRRGGTAAAVVDVARLPRRRRPGVIAAGVALICLGIVISAALYQRADRQVQVLVVTANVPMGGVISSGDIGTASIAATGVSDIPAAQRGQVTGLIAATALQPGTLLSAADVTGSVGPPPGEDLVTVTVVLPASGLTPGDKVLLIPTPAAANGASSSGTGPLTSPVAATVEAVNPAVGQNGLTVVDVLVASGAAASVVDQNSTGQLGMAVTWSAPR
jgi:hypothetical protein